MKITNISIENLLGARRVHAALSRPIVLLAGHNGAGKSSIRDCVKLAITGDLTRITVKKDSGQLVTDDASAGYVTVTCDEVERTVTITQGGKISEKGGKRDIPEALRFAFEGQRFARLKPDERRAFLFDLMGLSISPAAIVERLRKRNLLDEYIDRIAPLLRGSIGAACEEAKGYARDKKTAWRTITGETYGSEKAVAWQAEKPDVDKALITELRKRITHIDTALGSWQEQVGQLKSVARQREDLQGRIPALQAQIELLQRRRTKLGHDKQELEDTQAALKIAQDAAGDGPRVGLVHDLAKLVSVGMFGAEHEQSAQDALAAYEQQHGALDAVGGDPEARARAVTLDRAAALLASAVTNGERDVAASEAAAAQLEQVNKQLADLPAPEGLGDAQRQIESLQQERRAAQERLTAHEALQRRADQADSKTRDAAEAHAAVKCWEAIADALSPSGIQAEMLAEAIEPLNARLSQSAIDADWPHVRVTNDIEVVLGDRDRAYELFSESEQWRADAMLAEAFAFISGVRLLVLDRADVLDIKGRDDLFAWLQVLVEAGEIDTVLVFATLRAIPPADVLPQCVQAIWINAGQIDAANSPAMEHQATA